jgi:hypothetical protein
MEGATDAEATAWKTAQTCGITVRAPCGSQK